MTLSTSFAKNSKPDIENSANPMLHLFTVDQNLTPDPVDDYKGEWTLASPETVRDFSAVTYYFGRKLQEELKVPVGVICTAYGGTPIKTWMSKEMLANAPATVQVEAPPNAVAIRERYEADVVEWHKKVLEARANGSVEPERPVLPWTFYAESSAFNAMINPLIPYTVRGFVWYQGEADASFYPFKWRDLFACMIKDWRDRWGDTTLPVVFVQLPPFEKRSDKPVDSFWAVLREQQLMARRIPFAYMACTIDVVNAKFVSIHLREKKEVADRLAACALASVYRKPVPYSGPIYDSMEINEDKIKINFRYAENGLVSKNGEVTGFEIAARDRVFVRAKATIQGDSVVVWSDKVHVPVAVRYGWSSNPLLNLYNKADLPASPFRTDKWMVPSIIKHDI